MRPRSNRNRTLPPNLYARRDGYFVYIEPARSIKRPGARHTIGRDRLKAMEIARELNTHLIPIRDVARSILDAPAGKSVLLNQFIPKFIEHSQQRVDGGHMAPSTLKAWTGILKRVEAGLGDRRLETIGTYELAQFLEPIPPRMANVFRIVLMQVFQLAIAKGHITANPVTNLKNKDYSVQRERLSLEGFWAVHEQANPVLQLAMELFLHTMQRPVDLVKLKFADFVDGHVLIEQQKTGVKVKLPISKTLADVIKRARTMTDSQGFPVASEYVLHKIESLKSKQRGKPVSTEWLSKAFADVRDSLDLFKDMEAAKRPTFYEIRSLGASLYDEQGINPQNGLGHLTETMTRLYLSRRKGQVKDFNGELKLSKPTGGKDATGNSQ